VFERKDGIRKPTCSREQMGSEHINIPRTKLDGKDPKNVPRGSYGISAQKCYLV
jgi:hypothetical protein